MPPTTTVLIADDHRLFAEALEAILAGEPEIEVVGRARNGEEAVQLALELEQGIVFLAVVVDELTHAALNRTRPMVRRPIHRFTVAAADRADGTHLNSIGFGVS